MGHSEPVNGAHSRLEPHLWPSWVLVAALSGALIGGLSVRLEFIAPLVLMLMLGAAQALVLRRYLPSEARCLWIGAGVLGWFIGTNVMILLRMFNPLTQDPGVYVIFGLRALDESIVMAAIGAAQWLVLRQHWHGTGLWIPASAMGGALSGVLSISLCWVYCQSLPLVFGLTSGSALSLGVAWASYGLVTGVVLAQVLSHKRAGHYRHPSM